MVDDEASWRREAVWSEPAAGTVAGADEQVGAGRGVHDLTLDPAGAFEAFGWPGQSGSGGGEQRCAQRNHRRGSQSLRSDP
jgi:hypothetical protein